MVCGIRGEILTLSGGERAVLVSGSDDGSTSLLSSSRDALRSYPLIVPNLELNTGCSAQYHPGPPSDFAQTMTQRLRSLLLDVVCPVNAHSLEITGSNSSTTGQMGELDGGMEAAQEIKAYWVLYIDTLMICLDGNAFDVAWAAIMAALYDTKLPIARWDPDYKRVLCDPVATKPLQVNQLAFSATFGVFTAPPGEDTGGDGDGDGEGDGNGGGKMWILADPDEFEEGVCEERILVVMRDENTIAKVEKGGGRVAGPRVGTGLAGVKHLQQCVNMAGKRWKVWNELMKGKGKGKTG